MMKFQDTLYRIIFFFIIFILLFPLVDHFLKLSTTKKLSGDYKYASNTEFNINSWLSGAYQQKKADYLADNFRLRNYFVRSHNQFNYRYFGKVQSPEIFVGRESFLFRYPWKGFKPSHDYVGVAKIEKTAKKIRVLQDSLKERNTLFLFVITPEKYYFYKDFVPNGNREVALDTTNYRQYVYQLKNYNINHIDFNKWFIEIKDTCKYTLMSKNGIHWTLMGALIAMDSIMDYVKSKQNINYPSLMWTTPLTSEYIWEPDIDIFSTLNLLDSIPKNEFPLYYPNKIFSSDSSLVKPRVIVIGDSYFNAISWNGIPNKLFHKSSEFWYYNREGYDVFNHPINDIVFNLKSKSDALDIVIIMCSPSNLSNPGWGVLENF